MSNLQITQIDVNHIINIYPRRRGFDTQDTLEEFFYRVSTFVSAGNLTAFPTYALEFDGKTIALLGMYKVHDTTAQLWLIGTDDLKRFSAPFVKLCRRLLLTEFLEHKTRPLNRVQAEVRMDRPDWIAFMKVLGFQEEGIMKCFYTDKTDALMMARIK